MQFWRLWRHRAKRITKTAQRCSGAIAKAAGKYKGRVRSHDYAVIKAWRAAHGASIQVTAENFGVGTATVKRACAEITTGRPGTL